MRSPPQIALEPLPQAHRVVMSIEKLIDHERQHIARGGLRELRGRAG